LRFSFDFKAKDTYLGVNLDLLYAYHLKLNSDITMTLKPMKNFDRYESVKFIIKKKFIHLRRKYIEFGYINCGYIYLKKNILKSFQKLPFSLENDFINKKINENKY
jgi:D-glycero-alpha-D-manno-heptose 1-phosphate guanylyltransferase